MSKLDLPDILKLRAGWHKPPSGKYYRLPLTVRNDYVEILSDQGECVRLQVVFSRVSNTQYNLRYKQLLHHLRFNSSEIMWSQGGNISTTAIGFLVSKQATSLPSISWPPKISAEAIRRKKLK